MSFQETVHTPAINASETDRATFVGLVYQHVAAAVAAFIAFEVVLFVTGIASAMEDFFLGGGGGRWMLMLGLVMGIQWFAGNAAADLGNPSRQYLGLFGSALGQAIIFAPFLSYVFRTPDGGATVEAPGIPGEQLSRALAEGGAELLYFSEARLGLQASFELLVDKQRSERRSEARASQGGAA